MYTLVCYRPEHFNTFLGQVILESSSDFQIYYFENVKDAAMQDAAYQIINHERSKKYAEWIVKVLVDGLDENQWLCIESNYQIMDQPNVWNNYDFHLKNSISILQEQQIEFNKHKVEQEEQRTSDLIKVALRVKEENERLEFEHLSKKYGYSQ